MNNIHMIFCRLITAKTKPQPQLKHKKNTHKKIHKSNEMINNKTINKNLGTIAATRLHTDDHY